MSRMDKDDGNDSDSLAKLLLIGDGKVGKSYYAGMAAAAGFNVLYFDGDVARPTLKGLPLAAKQRIYALDVADTLGGGVKDSKFLDVMLEWTSSTTFKWNDSQARMAKRSDAGDEIWEIKPALMDHTCVFVLDSWTGLCESMTTAAAVAHGVDITTAKMSEMRPVYQAAGLKSMQMLQCIRSMRCHVIVLAHPDEYSHTTKPVGKSVGQIKETELIVDWTKLIPKSTSKPNSMQMAKYFTDVAWMESNATGSERLYNGRMSDQRISGGHLNDRRNTEEYSFANLVKVLGGKIPTETPSHEHWLKIIPPGEAATPILATQVLDGTSASQVKVAAPTGGGMAGMFQKKAVTPA